MNQLLSLKRKALLLYYNILKNHSRNLPPKMRQFGNKYVRFQFDQHQNNPSTVEQYKKFYEEWWKYNQTFKDERNKGTSFGKEMTEREMGLLSKEQRESLGKLKDKTKQL